MQNILITLIKFVLGMKFGWVILLVIGIVFVLSLLRNIISGSFSVGKLAAGFNPFTGAIQGKLIWMAIWAFIFFTAYQFIMRPTTNFDTDYKNQIHHNADVIIDQRVGPPCIPTKILWGLITIGCKGDAIDNSEVNNGPVNNAPQGSTDCSKCKEEAKKDTSKKEIKKETPKENKGNKSKVN